MNKKTKRAVTVLMIFAAVLLFICLAGMWYMRDKSFMVGNCIAADNGAYLICRDGEVICMTNKTGASNRFDSLKTGDKLLIVNGFVEETYPGSTDVYICLKFGNGTISDIPQDVIDTLRGLGWLAADEEAEPE